MGGRGGSSAGASTFRGRGARNLRTMVARAGGVLGQAVDIPFRGQMREHSMALVRAAFTGATAAQAESIALGRRKVMNASQMPLNPHLPPIKINIDRGKVHLIDGRHRAEAAKEAGAKNIRAHVSLYNKKGTIVATYTGPVKL